MPIVVRALGKLGDAKLVDTLLPLLSAPGARDPHRGDPGAVAKLADERRAEQVRARAAGAGRLAGPDHRAHGAPRRIAELDNRIAGSSPPTGGADGRPAADGADAAATPPPAVRPPQPRRPRPAQDAC